MTAEKLRELHTALVADFKKLKKDAMLLGDTYGWEIAYLEHRMKELARDLHVELTYFDLTQKVNDNGISKFWTIAGKVGDVSSRVRIETYLKGG